LIDDRFQPRVMAAAGNRLDPGAGDNAPFALQSSDREDHHMP
jgi:hypothetical protein